MQSYKIYHPLALSFYSKDLYRDAAQNWPGYGLRYLLFLVSLLSLFSIGAYLYDRSLILTSLEPIITQMPVITVKDGVASTEKNIPYYIKDPKTNQLLAIIDTSGAIKSLDNTNATFLMTDTQFIMKKNSGSYQDFKLSNIKNGVYDQPEIRHLVKEFSLFVAFAFVILFFFLRFAKAILVVLIIAGIAKLLTHTTLSYQTLCRIAAIAVTPAFILAMLLELFRISIPFVTLLYFALSVAYLFYGMEANKPSNQS